jgi:alpha-amylase/alpha-mannosidase (GH57 family)
MEKPALCIHGHFYQPPRENPLTGLIPDERGAAPYRNWNERIHAECYRPNAELGNFKKISFNIGPTLLDWMTAYDSVTRASIITQAQEVYHKYGVSNAMAQPYHHTILPLSSRADKVTQVRWGLIDFEHHFGFRPTGMWLPETAVDLDTLVVLADHGMEYTILAPWQAKKPVDTRQPYWVALPGARKMAVFFYNQDLSTRISFDPASTVNADQFVTEYIMPNFSPNHSGPPQFEIIASDGELYGHHQQFRDKFLAHLLNSVVLRHQIDTTFPGKWLKTNQPVRQVEIHDATSWSCHHGVVRWMGECGCTPGARWKAPFRRGFNQLAAALDRYYLDYLRQYTTDPWALRHDYIRVRLHQLSFKDYLRQFIEATLTGDEIQRIQMLLAVQYERQRMFTSCGWFFDDLDRIEPRNAIAYAAQAVWLNYQATGVDLSVEARTFLKHVKSLKGDLHGDAIFTDQYYKTQQLSQASQDRPSNSIDTW